MKIRCRDCGRFRLGVTLRTFVCRYCLSLRGGPIPAAETAPTERTP